MKIEILDHGYVELIEHMGSDERIIEAARMSTGKGFLGWGMGICNSCGAGFIPKESVGMTCGVGLKPTTDFCKGTIEYQPRDSKLLRYLYEHKHLTPFEMTGVVLEIKAPIFVFREWHRHRTQSYNEMSARYIPLPDENYVPSVERIMMQGGANKQAQGSKPVTENMAQRFQNSLRDCYNITQMDYEGALSVGIPKELARLLLPVARYSKMRASTNLRNWLAFLTLRMDPAAQWEIRQYANAVHDILITLYPRTMELFDEHKAT